MIIFRIKLDSNLDPYLLFTFNILVKNIQPRSQGILSISSLGIIGSALTYACTPKIIRENLGVTMVNTKAGVDAAQGFGLELLFTFLLVFFVFSITDEKKKVEPYGTTLGIGIVILVCHVCLVSFTA